MDRKTTQLRVVFYSSSKCPGEICLNDALYSGPNLLLLLFDMLIRFRLHKVAVTADIEETFLNLLIKENIMEVEQNGALTILLPKGSLRG